MATNSIHHITLDTFKFLLGALHDFVVQDQNRASYD